MGKTSDFFINENHVDYVSEEDYNNLGNVISTAQAIARMTYNSVYVIDYYKQNFLYVSENPLFLCGMKPDEVKEMGYSFYMNHVPEDEISFLLEINRAGFIFFNRTPVEDRIKLSISYDFHIQNKDKKVLINHKLTPVLLAENGNIWIAACYVSLSSNKEAGNIEAHMEGRPDFWTYSLESHAWKKEENISMTEREKEIILLSAQGLTMEEIAEKLYIAISTVKFHKNKLFSKLHVKTISEAIAVVTNHKMI